MTDPQDLTTRRKRVLYRANHRGTQEMDILIGGYVADHLDTLDPANHEETDLQAWLLGQRDIPENADRDLIDTIRNHKISRTEFL
jgi:antitoxin CptB